MKNDFRPELLAPAGSPEIMKACYAAGADAVYMGLNMFSARAYAANTGQEEYIRAIRYAHERGKKLYLTLNTLMKEKELNDQLYELIAPLYKAGLDAVIVQDAGLMRWISLRFPGLPIHASTQVSVCSQDAADLLKTAVPIKRFVPARELSLRELKIMSLEHGTELECFIHGALCYSYSGQCLMSSLYGGRSGNRGRCAQPCRLLYSAEVRGRESGEKSLLSLKDLNTLRLLPELIEAGIASFKIEGRMKSAEYAAGVTSIYRKYIDLFLEKGREAYRVDRQDEVKLLSLFRRRGYSEGYYHRQNGKEMISLSAEQETEDQEFLRTLRERYINNECHIPVRVYCRASKGEPLLLRLSCDTDGISFSAEITSSQAVEPSRNAALPKETLKKQLGKLGTTPFYADQVQIEADEDIFLPIAVLNETRRAAAELLRENICRHYERDLPEPEPDVPLSGAASGEIAPDETESTVPAVTALVRTAGQLKAALQTETVSRIIIESTLAEAEDWEGIVRDIHECGKKAFLALPEIFRDKALAYFDDRKEMLFQAGFDGLLVRNMEEAGFLKRIGSAFPMTADHRLYTFNHVSGSVFMDCGFQKITVPAELNAYEAEAAGLFGQELMVYGRLPLMISANCIKKTLSACDHTPGEVMMTDRKQFRMPVISECRYCYNLILNAEPLSLLQEKEQIGRLCPSALRLIFTTETEEETAARLKAFSDVFVSGLPAAKEDYRHTRGHFRRGVE